MPKVSAVLVNWNRADDTVECVRSLLTQSQSLENIIVVENGSDEEPSFVSHIADESLDNIEVIDTGKNLGFGAGANLGMRRALELGAEYVLVINNDTVADRDMLKYLLEESQACQFELSAPLIFYHAEPEAVWSSGGNICRLIGLPFNAHHRKNPPNKNTQRSFLTACCLLISKHALEKVDFFDEEYFMYYEDLDYMAKAQTAGLKAGVIPSAKLWHKEAQSSGGYLNPNERYWMARSLMRYSKKATSWWNALPLWLHRITSAFLWTLRLLFTGKVDALKAYWRGLFDGLRSKSPLQQ